MRERAWLIEFPTGTYWCGGETGWSADHNKAVRFCRRQDAEAAMRWLRHTSDAKATEHVWLDAHSPEADIVERLQRRCGEANGYDVYPYCDEEAFEAAGEIERLRAALERINGPMPDEIGWANYPAEMRRIARAALAGETQ